MSVHPSCKIVTTGRVMTIQTYGERVLSPFNPVMFASSLVCVTITIELE